MDSLPGTGSTSSTSPSDKTPERTDSASSHGTGLNRQISHSESSPAQTGVNAPEHERSAPADAKLADKRIDEVPASAKTQTKAGSFGSRVTQGIWSTCKGLFRGVTEMAYGAKNTLLDPTVNAVKDISSRLISKAKDKTYDQARSLLSSKAGVDLQLSDEEWHRLLNEVLLRAVGQASELPEYQDIHIPAVTIKQKNGAPITVRQIKLDARPGIDHTTSASVGNQSFINSLDIRRMTCTVDITPPGMPTMQLHLAMTNGQVTFGTELLEIFKHPIDNRNDLWNTVMVGGKNAVLPFDQTAVHLTAKQLIIGYNHVGARVPFPDGTRPAAEEENPIIHATGHYNSRSSQTGAYPVQPPPAPVEAQNACVTGFHKGKVTLKDVSLGRPVNLLRSSTDQSTIFHCSGLKFENSADLPALMDIHSFELSELDDQHSGELSGELVLNPIELRNIKPLNLIPSYFLKSPVRISLFAPVEHGELAVTQLKKGTTFKTRSRLFSWLFNGVMSSPDTRLVCSASGEASFQIAIPVLRSLPYLGKYAVIQVPLPLKGLVEDKGDGRIIVSDLVGGIGDQLNDMKILPGHYHFSPPALESSAIDCSRNTLLECQRLYTAAKALEAKAETDHQDTERLINKLKQRAQQREITARTYPDPESPERKRYLAGAQRFIARANAEAKSSSERCQQLKTEAKLKLTTSATNMKHYLAKCRELIARAETLEANHHHNEAARMYKAIPADAYALMIREGSPEQLQSMHYIAHLLTAHDSAKANIIYIELLRRYSPDQLPEAEDPRWLVSLAQHIPPDTEENKKVRYDILEFACKTNPHSGALQVLAMDTPAHYSSERLRKLIQYLMDENNFRSLKQKKETLYNSPALLASTVLNLQSQLGVEMKALLEGYPLLPLLDLVREGDPKAESLLDGLRECMLKHKLSDQAASTHIDLDDPLTARVVLEQGIERDDERALQKLVRMELQAADTPDHADCITACQRLLKILATDRASPKMKETAREMLQEVWEHTYYKNIGRQILNISVLEQIDSPYRKAFIRLFSVSKTDYHNQEKMTEMVRYVEEELAQAKTSTQTSPAERSCIPALEQLLEAIDEDLSFMDAVEELPPETPEPEPGPPSPLPVVAQNVPVQPESVTDESDDEGYGTDQREPDIEPASAETSPVLTADHDSVATEHAKDIFKEVPVIEVSSSLRDSMPHPQMPDFSLTHRYIQQSRKVKGFTHLKASSDRSGRRRRYTPKPPRA